MLFKFISYLNFLRCSTNQHDVHSPFVYDFVTKCLYQPPEITENKAQSVAFKCIEYFKCMVICSDNKLIKSNEKPYEQSVNPRFDLVYLAHPDSSKIQELLKMKKLKNDSLLIIENIYKNKNYYKAWKSVIKMTEITVSIDLFYCGVLFVRKEQVKEHFTIRI